MQLHHASCILWNGQALDCHDIGTGGETLSPQARERQQPPAPRLFSASDLSLCLPLSLPLLSLSLSQVERLSKYAVSRLMAGTFNLAQGGGSSLLSGGSSALSSTASSVTGALG